jgi:signal peptidase II
VPSEPSQVVANRRHRLLALSVAALVIAADQVTKTWALRLPETTIAGEPAFGRHIVGTVYLDLTFNSGAAFGLGRGVTPIVEGVVVVLVAALLFAGRRAARRPANNLTDRIFRHHGGAVIDFFNVAQVNTHEYWPVFNVADSCIVVGAIVLAYQMSRVTVPGDPGRGAPAAHRSADD